MDESPEFAALSWSRAVQPEGLWQLRLSLDESATTSPVIGTFEGPGPPSLLDRHNGLVSLGFTQTEYGPEAWRWHESESPDGHLLLVAIARVRPLVAGDVAPDDAAELAGG